MTDKSNGSVWGYDWIKLFKSFWLQALLITNTSRVLKILVDSQIGKAQTGAGTTGLINWAGDANRPADW